MSLGRVNSPFVKYSNNKHQNMYYSCMWNLLCLEINFHSIIGWALTKLWIYILNRQEYVVFTVYQILSKWVIDCSLWSWLPLLNILNIICFLQSNEVDSSFKLEKEDLMRSVAFVEKHGIEIDALVISQRQHFFWCVAYCYRYV